MHTLFAGYLYVDERLYGLPSGGESAPIEAAMQVDPVVSGSAEDAFKVLDSLFS